MDFYSFIGSTFFQSILSIITIALAFYIGIKQNRINNHLYEIQNYVELFCYVGVQTLEGEATESKRPVIMIKNISSKIIYINELKINNNLIEIKSSLAPTIVLSDSHYWIPLPSEAHTHNVTVFFSDFQNKKWETEINCHVANNVWQLFQEKTIRV